MAEEDSIDIGFEAYDSEIIAIRRVIADLNASRWKVHTVDGWRAEIVDRFAAINMRVGVVLRQVEEVQREGAATIKGDGSIVTSITVQGRIDEEKEFDHERMGAEVRADLLGLNHGMPVRSSRSFAVPPAAHRRQSGLFVPGADPRDN